jgi:predicted nucleic acid-binding protein
VGKGYLIDSNAIIDFFNKSLPEKGRDLLFKIEPNISIITFIEVLAKSSANANELIEIRRFCENCKVY